MSDQNAPTTAAPQTALAVQQNALTALLADPERLNALPIDKLERLFDLNERMLERSAKASFQRAFKAVQDQVEPVPKRGRIDYGRGKGSTPYAKPEDVVGMLRPLLRANGLSYSTSSQGEPVAGSVDGKPMTRMTLKLRHEEGHEEAHHLDVPVAAGKGGSMNLMQAIASTASYCEKHLLCKVFGVVTADDHDGQDVKGQEPITAEQVANIEDLSADVGIGPAFAEFLRSMFSVERIEQIASSDYKQVIRAIEARRKFRQNAEGAQS